MDLEGGASTLSLKQGSGGCSHPRFEHFIVYIKRDKLNYCVIEVGGVVSATFEKVYRLLYFIGYKRY